jgi:hypothetical protein
MFGEDRISMIQLEEPECRECSCWERKEGATEPADFGIKSRLECVLSIGAAQLMRNSFGRTNAIESFQANLAYE